VTQSRPEPTTPTVRGSLSDEDLAAFRTYTADISDIPAENQHRIRFGFQVAYDSARLVREGLKDPMSL
jgi:hypothetical protein